MFSIRSASPSAKSFSSGMLGGGFVELKPYVFYWVSLDQGSGRRKSSTAGFSKCFSFINRGFNILFLAANRNVFS